MLIHPQAIVLMSLANGKSSIKMPRLTNQAKAAMLAVETFTEVKFNVSSKTAKNVVVECEGLGLVNEEVLPEDNYESDDEDESEDEHESRDKRVSDDEHESDHAYELDEEHGRM
ncbi:uncharacterized protein LOC110066636 [Orbicella faveolata]|uniref:uncharacterized protein LOC110066636 n=1 Tax=Orbicella faveolata TaxID=48498 RepID=UPI0009E4BCBD|nr:uncharacterized protein LOC110066636 [Orbicella faveolata]